MIVGVHRVADVTLRLYEYSPGFDPERFAVHEGFFVEDVGAWARARFGVTLSSGRTAVFGVSAGGELVLALGFRHPDLYGAIFSGSPGGGYRPPHVMPLRCRARTSGLARWNRFSSTTRPGGRPRCGDAAVDVMVSEWVAGHDDTMWQEEFPLMVAWAFGG